MNFLTSLSSRERTFESSRFSISTKTFCKYSFKEIIDEFGAEDDRYSFEESTDDLYRLRQACPSFRPEFVRVVADNDIDGAEVWTWENRGVHSFFLFYLV